MMKEDFVISNIIIVIRNNNMKEKHVQLWAASFNGP